MLFICKGFFDKYDIMLLDELYKPKIGKNVSGAVNQYYANRYSDTPVDKEENLNWLNEKLSKLGWKPLSLTASYSNVYENPKKNYVLKVNKQEDKGYDRFVQLTRRVRNKHFPKISDRQEFSFGNKEYKFTQHTFYAYLIEKLQPIPEPYNENYAVFISSIAVIYQYEMNPSYSLLREILFRDYLWDDQSRADAVKFIQDNPDIVKAAAILGNALKYYKINLDLHDKNIMQRADGTVVIIDPYVG
jgi:hypothetical protein